MNVHVRRRHELAAIDPGDCPAANVITTEIRQHFPQWATRGKLREQLDKAYVDAIYEIDERFTDGS